MMKNLLIVYHSQTGNTQAMAKAVAEGATAAGINVTLKRAAEADDSDILNCDAVAIGTPNYFSYMAGMVKDFFDRIWRIVKGKMADKPYATFGSYGGGGAKATETVDDICARLEMKKICETVCVPREPTEENLVACRELGKKMAEMM